MPGFGTEWLAASGLDMPGFGTEWLAATAVDIPAFGTVWLAVAVVWTCQALAQSDWLLSAEIPPLMAAASLKMVKLTHVWDQYVTDWDVPGFGKE